MLQDKKDYYNSLIEIIKALRVTISYNALLIGHYNVMP